MVPRSLRSLLLFFFSIFLCSRGYIIDDREVTFVPTSGPKAWQQYSDPTAYAGTITDNACVTVDGCSFTFSFTGSGVSLTRVIVTGISIPLQATVTVDGAPQAAIMVPDGSPLTVVYDLQSLPYGAHTMLVTLVTYNGGVASHFRLDSINVNTTDTSTTTSSPTHQATVRPSTTSGNAAQTSNASGSNSSNNNLGAIIGGVVGGIVLLILLALLLLWLRRILREPMEESPTKLKRALSSLFGHTAPRAHDAPPPRPTAAPALYPLKEVSSRKPGSLTPPRTRRQRTGWQPPPSSAPPEFPPPPIPFMEGLAVNRSQDSLDRVYGKMAPTDGKPTKFQSTSADAIPNALSHTSGSVTNASSQSLSLGPPLVTVPTQPINPQPVSSGPPLVTVPVPSSHRTPITQPVNSQPMSSGPPLVTVPVSNSTPLTPPIIPESTTPASVPTSKPTKVRPLPNPRQATSSGPPLATIPASESTPANQPTNPQLTSSGPPPVTVPTSNPTPLKRPIKPDPASSDPPLVVFNATARPQDSTSALSTTSTPSAYSMPSSRLTQTTYSSNFSSPTLSRHLTDGEVEFIAGLYRRLPPSEVARVVETMLHGPGEPRVERGSSQGGSSVMAPTSVEDLPPYDTRSKS